MKGKAFLLCLIGTFLYYTFRVADLPVHVVRALYTNNSSKFVTINGLEIHYRDERPFSSPKRDEAILLIHGTMSSLHTWDAWTHTLLNQGYRVIRLDLPGFGITGSSPHSKLTVANDVDCLAKLLNELKLQKVHVAGNSLGGLIATEFAITHPARVGKLILLAPGGLTSPHPIFQVSNIYEYVFHRQLVGLVVRKCYSNAALVTDDIVERYYNMALREGNRRAFGDRIRLRTPQDSNRLQHIKAPTLIVWGEEDYLIPADTAHKFHALIPQATLKFYDKVGHMPMEESPERSVKDVLEFLSS